MRGYIDKIDSSSVHGWAVDSTDPTTPVEIRVSEGPLVLGTVIADRMRKDVSMALNSGGRHGFVFKLPPDSAARINQPENVVVEARRPGTKGWSEITGPLANGASPTKTSNSKGSLNSVEKLRFDLMVNKAGPKSPLLGLKVLDLSPDSDRRSEEYLRLGATAVTSIKEGREKHASGTQPAVRNLSSINEVINEQFDVIVVLDTLHRISKPSELIKKCSHLLEPNGTLIIEWGVSEKAGKAWQAFHVNGETHRFPSQEIFADDLLRDYSHRPFSINGPYALTRITRTVFHCRHTQSIALVIAGQTKSGKTTLARALRRMGCPCLHTDDLLVEILYQSRYNDSPVSKVVREHAYGPDVDLSKVGSAIVKADLQREFVRLLMLEAPLEADIFAVEGEILSHAQVHAELLNQLSAASIKTWAVSPE